jgi:hypothetical protein
MQKILFFREQRQSELVMAASEPFAVLLLLYRVMTGLAQRLKVACIPEQGIGMALVALDVVDHGSSHGSRQTQDAQWMCPQMGEPVLAPASSVKGWSVFDRAVITHAVSYPMATLTAGFF